MTSAEPEPIPPQMPNSPRIPRDIIAARLLEAWSISVTLPSPQMAGSRSWLVCQTENKPRVARMERIEAEKSLASLVGTVHGDTEHAKECREFSVGQPEYSLVCSVVSIPEYGHYVPGILSHKSGGAGPQPRVATLRTEARIRAPVLMATRPHSKSCTIRSGRDSSAFWHACAAGATWPRTCSRRRGCGSWPARVI